MSDIGFTSLFTQKLSEQLGGYDSHADLDLLIERFENAVRDDEARAAADRVEALPYLNGGRTVNRNNAILAARRNLKR